MGCTSVLGERGDLPMVPEWGWGLLVAEGGQERWELPSVPMELSISEDSNDGMVLCWTDGEVSWAC